MDDEYCVVGHRGWPQVYPENSKRGLLAAAEAGAAYLELDVQISQDGVPMVIHDEKLRRVCGVKGYVWDYTAAQLSEISCHEPKRFGNDYFPEPVVRLDDLMQSLLGFDVTVFVELKEESFAKVSRQDFFECVKQALAGIAARAVIISFDAEILSLAKNDFSIGWVLRKMDAVSKVRAQELEPHYLIYSVKRLNKNSELWKGNWDWFLYDIVDPKEAQFWASKGVRFIETWDVKALL